MTELEEKILECAKKIMSEALKRAESKKTNLPFISIPFICEGVIDFLVYDKKAKKFTKIKYRYAIGQRTSPSEMGEFSGFCEDSEMREIDISDINL